MSLDLAEQDINVLWGSFEIKNTRLMHKLLQQFARQPLPAGDPSMEAELNGLADRFEKLPMTFMKFHGGSDVDDVRKCDGGVERFWTVSTIFLHLFHVPHSGFGCDGLRRVRERCGAHNSRQYAVYGVAERNGCAIVLW